MHITYWDFNISFMDNAINNMLGESFAYNLVKTKFTENYTDTLVVNDVEVIGKHDFAPYIKAEINNESPECMINW